LGLLDENWRERARCRALGATKYVTFIAQKVLAGREICLEVIEEIQTNFLGLL
jgi:hypothetical protein